MKRKIIAIAVTLAVVAGIGNIIIYGEGTVDDSLYERVAAVLSDVLDKSEETIEPELTAEPEETEEPELTAEPEKTAKPEETEEPELTAEPEETIGPELTAEPEKTAKPEETEEPELTAEPEKTSEPEATAAPTATAKPSSSGGGGVSKEDITVYMTVEKLTLGNGFILAPTAVTVKSDTTVAMLIDKVLGENNYQCDGTVEESMYVSAIRDSETEPCIPQYIAQKLDGIIKRRSDEWLSEFDYTRESGWKFSVNGRYSSASASDMVLSDGDVVRWQFTLYGYGADLDMDNNVYGTAQLKKLADKKRLITLVADLRETFGDSMLKKYPAYIAAFDALEKIDSTQAEVDAAYKQLSNTDFSDRNENSSGSGSVKISTSVMFETKVNEDESETVTANIATSAESFTAELDKGTIKKLSEKTERLNIRAADTVVSIPQSVFISLYGISPEKAELNLEKTKDSISVSLTSDGEVLDISGEIYMMVPFDAEGYEDCVLVTDGGKNVKYEYSAGVLKFSAGLNHVYNMRISPVLQFLDVEADTEYAAVLDELMRRGVIKGTDNNRFCPEGDFTTGMLALMLYRESGNDSAGFAWYVKPMEWATMNGFIRDGNSFTKVNGEILDFAMKKYFGESDYSAPDKEMTRAEGILEYSRYF